MKSLNYFLRAKDTPREVRSILYHIARSVKYINFSIRAGNTGGAGSQNSFGESQMALDVLSNTIITNELESSSMVSIIASEELEEVQRVNTSRGDYLVAFDPLDGSSLVDCNLAIGSIFGIWDQAEKVLGGKVDQNFKASVYAVYGPRVTLTLAIEGKGTHEFELNDVGEFILTRENIMIKEDTTYFAPGNLRVANQNEGFGAWVQDCISSGKKLRYSGGMVPDLHHILSKGHGIFTYPSCDKHPTGKLRLLFECAPFAMIFEEAGGVALTQDSTRVMDLSITDYHQNSSIFVGSKNAVEECLGMIQEA